MQNAREKFVEVWMLLTAVNLLLGAVILVSATAGVFGGVCLFGCAVELFITLINILAVSVMDTPAEQTWLLRKSCIWVGVLTACNIVWFCMWLLGGQ